jgi:uncharacterized protein YdaT
MPWTAADAEKYQKGLTKKQRRKWAAIANAIFESTKDEANAIKIANSKVSPAFNPAVPASMETKLKSLSAKEKIFEGMDPAMQKKIMSCIDAGGSPEECKKKCEEESQMGQISEMEIFRTGTHNGEPFDDKDLREIMDNFHALKDEVRPKLKITHREKQESLAGLASYGDIVDVFVKTVEDGSKRLFAKIANVPQQVRQWILDRRFPERSIEIYPKLKLGTKSEDKIYRNVLKAIALLGSEMPAVSGMAPIKLSENIEEAKTVCFGEVCFVCEEQAANYQATLLAVEMMAASIQNSIN